MTSLWCNGLLPSCTKLLPNSVLTCHQRDHYGDVTMGAIASQITSLTIVYSTLFRRRSTKTSKLRVTGLCAGISPGTGEFPAQMASNAENVSIWWRHHDTLVFIPGYYLLQYSNPRLFPKCTHLKSQPHELYPVYCCEVCNIKIYIYNCRVLLYRNDVLLRFLFSDKISGDILKFN